MLSSYRITRGSLGEGEMLWEHEPAAVFPQLFQVVPNFQECFHNSVELKRTCFLFLLENTMQKKENSLLTLIIKM